MTDLLTIVEQDGPDYRNIEANGVTARIVILTTEQQLDFLDRVRECDKNPTIKEQNRLRIDIISKSVVNGDDVTIFDSSEGRKKLARKVKPLMAIDLTEQIMRHWRTGVNGEKIEEQAEEAKKN